MLTYVISSGELLTQDGSVLGVGWAGHGEGRNNPQMVGMHGVGPIPPGRFKIEEPEDNPHTGPFSMPLVPQPDEDGSLAFMLGRSAFLIHGEAISDPENSSDGCIIMMRPVREAIWNGGDHDLQVILDTTVPIS